MATKETIKKENQKQKPHYTGHRDRLKDKFLKNPSSVNDYEILELILFYCNKRQDVKEMAKNILSNHRNSLANVLYSLNNNSDKLDQCGNSFQVMMKLSQELQSRAMKENLKNEIDFDDSIENVVKFLQNKIGYLKYEVFYVLFLNNKNQLITNREISRGTESYSNVSVKSLVRSAIESYASKVVIAHNHPSGSVVPSNSDLQITKLIQRGLDAVEIELVDHVIISGDKYKSLSECGVL